MTTSTPASTLLTCMRALAARCDGARSLDGAGFSGHDAGFGRSLASCSSLSERQYAAGRRMIQRYRVQVESVTGLDVTALPVSVAPAAPTALSVSFDETGLRVSVPFALKDAFKDAVPGRRWDSETKSWLAPTSSAPQVRAFAAANGLEITESGTPSTSEAPATPESRRSVQVLHGRVVFASEFDPALVAAFKALPGRKWDFHNKTNSAPVNPTTREFAARWDFPLDEIDAALDARDETERVADAERAANRDSSVASEGEAIPGAARGLAPYAYQWAGVRHVLAHRRVLIGDEMGVGKTITAIVSLVAADTFPAVIVVPEIVRGNWVREFERFAPGVSVEIASGSQPYDTTAEVVVIGYTVLRSNEGAWADRLARRGVRALVVDEAHGIKNRDSAQSRAVDRLARAVRTRERWSA